MIQIHEDCKLACQNASDRFGGCTANCARMSVHTFALPEGSIISINGWPIRTLQPVMVQGHRDNFVMAGIRTTHKNRENP